MTDDILQEIKRIREESQNSGLLLRKKQTEREKGLYNQVDPKLREIFMLLSDIIPDLDVVVWRGQLVFRIYDLLLEKAILQLTKEDQARMIAALMSVTIDKTTKFQFMVHMSLDANKALLLLTTK